MGPIQGTASRAFSAVQTGDDVSDPEFSAHEIFNAIEKGDAEIVARVLDEGGYDAAARDEDGNTILHLAVSCANEKIVTLLLKHGANDPAILNAKDSRGLTPLVVAAAAHSVPIMQILLDAGARVDDAEVEQLLDHPETRANCHWSSVAAEMFVRANGDVSEAFTLSVRYGISQSATLYFSAGANTIHALSLGPKALERMSDWHCIRAEDVLTLLDQVQRSGNLDACRTLLSASVMFQIVRGMTGQTDESIAAIYQAFVATGTDPEALVAFAANEYATFEQREDFSDELRPHPPRSDYFHALRSLIAVGAPTTQELVNRSRATNKQVMASLVRLGADVLGAMPQLNQSSARTLSHAALRHVLQLHGASEAQAAEKLIAIIRAGGAVGAADLASDLIESGGSLDQVKLLFKCGAAISDWVLVAAAKRAYDAEQSRPPDQLTGRSPEYQLLGQLVSERVDYSSISQARDSRNTICPAIGGRYGDLAPQKALNMIMAAQLQSLLQQRQLSAPEKVMLVKEIMSQGENPAAEEMLRDAVIGQHSATVKVLVLADVPATQAYIALGRMIYAGNAPGSKAKTQTLARLGADSEPAVVQLVKNIEGYTAEGDFERARIEQDTLNELRLTIASALQNPTS